MKKRSIAVKPAETLVIQLSDGTEREAIFNMEALIIFAEEFGDLTELTKKFTSRPYELAAMILYSGMKILDASVTFEEAKAIMVGGGVVLLAEIMEMFYEGFADVDQAELKKNLLPAIISSLHNNKARKRKK